MLLFVILVMDLFTTISKSVSAFSDLSEILPLIFRLKFAQKKEIYFLLGLFFIISAPLKLISLITAILIINNMPLYTFMAISEGILVYFFFSKLLFNKVHNWPILIIVLFHLLCIVFSQSIFEFNSYSWTFDMLIILLLGISNLFKLYSNDKIQTSLEGHPEFIITAGWLIYASGSMFTYLMGTSILSGKAGGFYHNAWIFQCVSNILKNIIICYGIWRSR